LRAGVKVENHSFTKKTGFSLVFPKKLLYLPLKKNYCHESHSHRRGLQIPILGTSKLQIRWNGIKMVYKL